MGVLAHEVQALRETLRTWAGTARRLWAARPGLERASAIAFVAAAAACGVLALLAQARLPGRLPGAEDWAALRALVERDARPGDAVVLSPPWAERAREILPASVPVFAGQRYAGEDLLGVRRVWLVSLPHAPGFSWRVEHDLLQRGAAARRSGRLGALEVSRIELSFPLVPLAFLPDHLAGGDGPGDQPAREVREVAGAPRPCLVVRVPAGPPLTLSFAPLRVGRILRGHVGALGGAALPATVRVSVLVDGEDAGAAEIAGGVGFVPFQVDTTRFADQRRPVSLVVTVAPGDAELCLDAATLP